MKNYLNMSRAFDVAILKGSGSSDIGQCQRTQEEIAKGLGKRQQYISEMLQIASLTEAELATLPPNGKMEKKQLLQLVKSRNRAAKTADKRKEKKPIRYEFKDNRLKVQVDFDMVKGDRLSLITTLEEILKKLREA